MDYEQAEHYNIEFCNHLKGFPVGKIAVCRSVFLITWYCILSAELNTVFWRFFPLGSEIQNYNLSA